MGMKICLLPERLD